MSYAHKGLQEEASRLADKLHAIVDQDAPYSLLVTDQGLALKTYTCSPLAADFRFSSWRTRRSEGKSQGLVRACKPRQGINIVDVTAGWGRDAAILASFGAKVIMIERHPMMAALLADALERRSLLDREQMSLFLQATDASVYLSALVAEEYPHVIYMDPMHPVRHKSALVKKEMQVLQQMIGADEGVLELLQLTISRVKQRVVVKWPQKLKPVLAPSFSVEGKTVRFDVYLPR